MAVPVLFLSSPFPLQVSSQGFCSLLLAAVGMHQPSVAEPEGQQNSSHGAHSLPPCGSILHRASGGLFQLKVFD